jgi:hypothetical protein
MNKFLIFSAVALGSLTTPVQAQQVSEVVAMLQRDGAITFVAIREFRTRQFDMLDKDKSGGLSEEEASGSLSIVGGRGGRAGVAVAGPDAGMSDDKRAERIKKMRERRQQRGDGQGAGQGRGGLMGAGGNPFARMQFMAADGDFDGQLTRAEFIEAPMPQLVRIDKDMDGRLTVEEIQTAQSAAGAGGAMQMDGGGQ